MLIFLIGNWCPEGKGLSQWGLGSHFTSHFKASFCKINEFPTHVPRLYQKGGVAVQKQGNAVCNTIQKLEWGHWLF